MALLPAKTSTLPGQTLSMTESQRTPTLLTKATLTSTELEVLLRLQRPITEASMDTDTATFTTIARLLTRPTMPWDMHPPTKLVTNLTKPMMPESTSEQATKFLTAEMLVMILLETMHPLPSPDKPPKEASWYQ
ncbi:unnamed protein product [Larinioides sclopetarius]|uniref:Uncharacterized protein n=1 Tax=Larinioides sclopetarius TaxID=280406 RepID=A0AAV2A6R4_9ARAC